MMKILTKPLNGILMVLFAMCTLFRPGRLEAWTSAHLFNIEVDVDIAKTGLSTVTTNARFVVEAGYFHGFDMVNLPGGELDKEAGIATLDDKRTLPVIFKRIRDGRVRVLLDDDRYLRKGGITFRVVHHIDLQSTGALGYEKGHAKLDFTPLVWDVGLDAMVLNIRFPKGGRTRPLVDKVIAKDYVVTVGKDSITAVKYRPVKWYPMRLLASFDSRLIPSIADKDDAPEMEKYNDAQPGPAVAVTRDTPSKRREIGLAALFVLFGFAALVLKARHVSKASSISGFPARFALLAHTSIEVRALLAFVSLLIGLLVQWAGFLAAAIPALSTAAALFVLRRQSVPTRPRPGGTWHPLSPSDLETVTNRLHVYQSTRRTALDATQLQGAAAMGVYGVILMLVLFYLYRENSQLNWTVVINGLIFAIPAWFSSVRSELPVNPMLEGFGTLIKWERSLSKLLGTKLPGSNPTFFIRHDEKGPIELRIKADSNIEGLKNIEVAGEVYRTGTLYRTRTVFVLRLEPGAPITRNLAACRGVAEHHLTPDLQEEIIVLRNRRGRALSQLTPLRTALAMMQG